MGRHRVGRRPWGPEQERLHPRDDRGRFAKTGGSKWAARLLKAAAEGKFEGSDLGRGSRFFSAQDALRAEHFRADINKSGMGRTPRGVIDIGATRRDIEGARKINAADNERDIGAAELSHHAGEVRVGSHFRRITGYGTENGRDYIDVKMDRGEHRKIFPEAGKQYRVRGYRRAPELREPLRGGQQKHMNQLQRDSQKPPQFTSPTRRSVQLAEEQANVDAALAAEEKAKKRYQAQARKLFPSSQGYGNIDRKEWVQRQLDYGEGYQVQRARQFRDAIANDPNTFLDQPSRSAMPTFTGTLDDAKPLAVYGDLLNIETEDQGTFRHLEDLEKLPPVIHQIVAAHMFSRRKAPSMRAATTGKTAGVFLGAKSVDELDSMGYLRQSQPGGSWDHAPGGNPGWAAVDGVYSDGTLVVGVTDYSSPGRGENAQPALHEFGHALDYAVAALLNLPGPGGISTASAQTDWRDIHRQAVAEAGGGLSPHYHDHHVATERGAREMWAEAFAEWARARHAEKARITRTFGPQTEWSDVEQLGTPKVDQAGTLKLMRLFNIKKDTAVLMHDYFMDLAKRLKVTL